jgi:hypothetical protein
MSARWSAVTFGVFLGRLMSRSASLTRLIIGIGALSQSYQRYTGQAFAAQPVQGVLADPEHKFGPIFRFQRDGAAVHHTRSMPGANPRF